MSWYFLGGFSAKAMVPSARVVNHSGWRADPRVVGGALEREVHRHLHAEGARLGDEGVEVRERAEVGVDRVVAAVGRADRVGAAGVLGAGVEGVVRSLLGGLADGVHRGEVDDVEAHVGDGREPGGGRAQRAGGPAVLLLVVGGALAAREQLVPRAGQGQLALHEERQVGGGGDVVAQGAGGQLALDRRVGARLEPHGGRAGGVAQAEDRVGEHRLLGGGALHLVAGPLEHQGALREHQLGVDVGPHLDRGVVLPGAVGVGPALDPVGPPAGAGCADPRRPGVEAGVGARHRLHVLGAVRGR